MPKVIIREIDNTTTPQQEYSNFSVVVPGYTNIPVGAKNVFDENGIYECSSQKDFENCVGKKAAIIGKTCAEYNKDIVVNTKEIYDQYVSSNKVYTWSIIIDEAEKVPGKYKIHNDIGWFKLNSTPESGDFDSTKAYVLIKNLGSDSPTLQQMGNQIAYELLGMGYTVLYKQIFDLDALKQPAFWECLKDKTAYDFRYICTGGYYNVDAYKCICDIANKVNKDSELYDEEIPGRGDCIALIDIDELNISAQKPIEGIKSYIKTLVSSGAYFINKYSALFVPKVTYAGEATSVETYQNLTFPASFHYLACAAYSKNVLKFNEWYAIANVQRGVCDKKVVGTSFKLGEIAINALQPRRKTETLDCAVNIIIKSRDNYILWGNRTANELRQAGEKNDDLIASDFLNIRQLCCTLKKEIYKDCRDLTFEPNSDLLWGTFCNTIKTILEKMKADQGIKDYKIIKVKDSKRALMTAKVRIVPIEAVEDFDISIYLEDSIASVETEE